MTPELHFPPSQPVSAQVQWSWNPHLFSVTILNRVLVSWLLCYPPVSGACHQRTCLHGHTSFGPTFMMPCLVSWHQGWKENSCKTFLHKGSWHNVPLQGSGCKSYKYISSEVCELPIQIPLIWTSKMHVNPSKPPKIKGSWKRQSFSSYFSWFYKNVLWG